VLPVTATVGGMPATVQFAGAAPGYLGLQQINVLIPANAMLSGPAVALVLTGGGVTTQSGVTVAIAGPNVTKPETSLR